MELLFVPHVRPARNKSSAHTGSGGGASMLQEEIMKAKLAIRSQSDQATQDDGKVRLGDMAPAFDSDRASSKPTAEAMKVTRDAATEDGGKVRLGDMAPAF